MDYSVINKSQLEGAHRLDAEYYQPEYLESMMKIKRSPYKRLGDLCSKITDGSHQTPLYQFSGVPFLMVKDIKEGRINFKQDISFISEVFDKSLKHCKPVAGDILLTKVGSVGISAVVPNDALSFNIFVSVAVLKGCVGIDQYFLSTFLNSKFGKFQAIRAAKGISQPDLHLEDIREFLIPDFTIELQKQVSKVVIDAINLFKQSESLYAQAEDLLLEELGLNDLQIENDLSFIVNLLDVKSANRVDAEYFQPKYELLVTKLRNTKSATLNAFVKEYSTGYPFKSENYQDEGIPLIRINNIKKGYLDLGDTAFLTERDYSLSREDIAKSGNIVLSMSGTIGMSALVPSDVSKCSTNQRILRFTPKDTDPDFLVLILNSIIGSYQLERIGTGGVQTNISYKDIKNILIPVLPKSTQQKIAELVRKSHAARKKSKELLEEAKRKVEEMIARGTKN